MAAFTTFSESQLERYLVVFQLGDLVGFSPIEQGTENSNYFITVAGYDDGVEKDFVLTIMESLGFDDVPFVNQLTTHLHHYGLPVAPPQRTLDGMTTTIFCGKPTLLFPRLSGEHCFQVTAAHCKAIGGALGEIHDATSDGKLSKDSE